MPERYDLRYTLTLADWLAANGQGSVQADAQRAIARRRWRWLGVLAASPLVILVCAMLVGGYYGEDLRVIGGFIGAALVVIMLMAVSHVKGPEPSQRERLRQVAVADFSPFCGAIALSVDPGGVRIVYQDSDTRVSWTQTRVTEGPFAYVSVWSDSSCIAIVPKTVFASPDAVGEFLRQSEEWRSVGELSHAARLARYLAERDLPCPYCQYNLRGTQSEKCPECGEHLQLERLTMTR